MEELECDQDGYRTIPLYDLSGTVIGSFPVIIPDSEIPEEIQEEIDQLEQKSRDAYAAKMAELAEIDPNLPWENEEFQESVKTVIDNGGYSVNSQGETYGSSLLSNIVGYEPDLSAAQGTNGQYGYIRRSEIRGSQFTIRTPQDALEYMTYLSAQPNFYPLPLYDCEGNVIGEFLYGAYGSFSESELSAILAESDIS